MLSILAGFMISIGAIAYIKIGGLLGAIFFSIGLISIICFKLELFTGKAGLYSRGEIALDELAKIWFGNCTGAFLAACAIILTPQGLEIAEAASKIVETRNGTSFISLIILGVFCGVLMNTAIVGYQQTSNILFLIAPVAVFIASGYTHCVADMFYLFCGCMGFKDFFNLIPVTIGNFIGCNLVTTAINWEKASSQYNL